MNLDPTSRTALFMLVAVVAAVAVVSVIFYLGQHGRDAAGSPSSSPSPALTVSATPTSAD